MSIAHILGRNGRPCLQHAANSAADDLIEPAIAVAASDVEAVPLEWLWSGWIAVGKLTLLAGEPGSGKTTVALGLAVPTTRGGPWPDGSPAQVTGSVLYWSGEDSVADTMKPRAHFAGVDCRRLFFVHGTPDLKSGGTREFDPATDLPQLEALIQSIGDVKLVVIDSIVSALPEGTDSHRNASVRRALTPLRNLAERLRVAVVGITHFSKNTSGRNPTERVNGSIALTALARTVLVAARGSDETRILAIAKNNLAADNGGIEYSIEKGSDLLIDGHIHPEVTRAIWGNPIRGTAHDLLAKTERPCSSRDTAGTWLRGVLSAGPKPVKVLQSEAAAAGLSWRTVEGAKHDLGVVAERKTVGNTGTGHWEWRLPAAEP